MVASTFVPKRNEEKCVDDCGNAEVDIEAITHSTTLVQSDSSHMDITEVRIKLADGNERLQAFCSITFDGCFVVRDIKIIDGPAGLFVAMPTRQNTTGCPHCRTKNFTKAVFCSQCGRTLASNERRESNEKLFVDIAHPIHAECREMIQSKILSAFQLEKSRVAESTLERATDSATSDQHHSLKRPHVLTSGGLDATVDSPRSASHGAVSWVRTAKS